MYAYIYIYIAPLTTASCCEIDQRVTLLFLSWLFAGTVAYPPYHSSSLMCDLTVRAMLSQVIHNHVSNERIASHNFSAVPALTAPSRMPINFAKRALQKYHLGCMNSMHTTLVSIGGSIKIGFLMIN